MAIHPISSNMNESFNSLTDFLNRRQSFIHIIYEYSLPGVHKSACLLSMTDSYVCYCGHLAIISTGFFVSIMYFSFTDEQQWPVAVMNYVIYTAKGAAN